MRHMRSRVVTTLLAASLCSALGGCPVPGGGSGGSGGGGSGGSSGASNLAGQSFSGTLNCTTTQSVNCASGQPQRSTRNVTVEFDANGRPTAVLIPGFAGADDQSPQLNQAGQSATLTFTSNNLSITMVVTVTEATYTADSATIKLSIDYSASGGSLTQTGTGTETWTATLDNGALDVSIQIDWDTTWNSAAGSFAVTETTSCTGTLQ